MFLWNVCLLPMNCIDDISDKRDVINLRTQVYWWW
jgi:hypothetical protein